jgi:hypothetical protein
MDEWRDVKGYEGLYQVSSQGRVMSCERQIMGGSLGGLCKKTLRAKELKSECDNGSRHRVQLFKEGKFVKCYNYDLVVQAFGLEVARALPQVFRKDGWKRVRKTA